MSLHKQLLADAAVAAANKAANIDSTTGSGDNATPGHRKSGSNAGITAVSSPRSGGGGGDADADDDVDNKDLKPIDEDTSDTTSNSDTDRKSKRKKRKKNKRSGARRGSNSSDSDSPSTKKSKAINKRLTLNALALSPRRAAGRSPVRSAAAASDTEIGPDGTPLQRLNTKYDATNRRLKEMETKHKRLEAEHAKLLRNYERSKQQEHVCIRVSFVTSVARSSLALLAF
jgi:hypothetical protein